MTVGMMIHAASTDVAALAAVDHLPQTHVSPVPSPKATDDVETPGASSRGSAG
jgi:hypothetical protein